MDEVMSYETEQILKGKICPYCKKETRIVDSIRVYKKKSYGLISMCVPCGAYVGVHKDTIIPLGRVAKKDLREVRKEAHGYFDRIWKNGYMDRTDSYKWLSEQLNTPFEFTHIAMFSKVTCMKVSKLSKNLINHLNSLGIYGEK